MSLTALHDVPAPAKVNLFLHVVGRRPDGFHLLQSVFLLVDWCDRLHFEIRSDGALQRHDLGPALPTDDLCLKAAHALQRASGCPFGADIHIDKQLPWGAGLGGGSSDAASTLLALNRLWNLRWPRERLLALALDLGADVPFFVGGRNAFVEGIGEKLSPLPEADMPPEWLAIVKPAQAIATPTIFASPDLVRNTRSATLANFIADARLRARHQQCRQQRPWQNQGQTEKDSGAVSVRQVQGSAGFGHNDLQPPAESLCPEIAQVANWLETRFGNSRMSGSGSAVFARAGIGSQPLATWTADELPPSWVGRLCRSLPRHPLVNWAD